ncbi:MAG: zf-HC2 domain-containing protein [Candidatus Eremiobacteraeota bacterium]|nr:zf-HC2 domain-containing protein [Candidatus Eremiobacteraeota bacterium]
MTCSKYQGLILDYTHGELDAATDADVFEHIQSCAACKSEWEAETKLSESLRAVFGDELELPTSVIATVRQRVHSVPSAGFITTLRAWLRPAVYAPAAALILVLVGLSRYGQVHTVQSMPQPSADYLVRQHLVQTMGMRSRDRTYSEYLLTSANDPQQNAAP